ATSKPANGGSGGDATRPPPSACPISGWPLQSWENTVPSMGGGDVSVKQMDQLAVALRPAGDDGNHGNPQRSGKGGNVDFQTAFFGDIHHVQAQNERHPHFEELNGKVEISFEIGSIHDVDQQVRIFVDQVCDRQLLLQRLGGQAVNAGKVH